ncbi:MAG: hypothetical protein AB4372_10135 [Xenococcus sp. (in: cyanobacteria)]
MGRSFAHITIKGQTQDAIVRYLEKLERKAYVSPSINSYVVIYDEKCNSEFADISNLSIQISRYFRCPTFSVIIYDESVFYYELYENGNLLDTYSSSGIDSFPEGGDAEKLCYVLGAKQSINRVRPILREPNTEEIYLFSSARHKKLVEELGLSLWSSDVIGGYQDIEEESIDAIIFDERPRADERRKGTRSS